MSDWGRGCSFEGAAVLELPTQTSMGPGLPRSQGMEECGGSRPRGGKSTTWPGQWGNDPGKEVWQVLKVLLSEGL